MVLTSARRPRPVHRHGSQQKMSDAASAFDLKTKYDQATWQVVEVLKKAASVRIIRFGSAAWGTLHENSDLDLWVFVELFDQLRRLLDGEKNSGD